jgi:outer membrane cobalamin receptor
MTGTRLLLMSATTVIVACSAPAVSSHSEDPRSQLITQDEIEASRAPTAYEVIQKLRANFLTYRGETSFDRSKSQPYPTVYLDGQQYGSVGMLRNIPASQVATIRLYRAWEATTKFGTGNMGGVIAITTRQ